MQMAPEPLEPRTPSPAELDELADRTAMVLSLFEAYYERVYAFLRKSAAPDLAEDLAQEVFVRLLQHPHLERLSISVSYLIKIAHNLLRRRYTRAARFRVIVEGRARSTGEAVEPPFARRGATFVDACAVENALDALTIDERNAVRMIVCEGKSYQHAAESLGVTVTTVNNWKHRGLVKMRRHIAERERDAERRPALPLRREPYARSSAG